MPRRARSLLGAVATLVAAAALAGCGLGPGSVSGEASVLVTEHFGATRLGSATEKSASSSETVMRMLERTFPQVTTRYGGGFVQSIDGHAGDTADHDWFYYVNGVQAAKGAAQIKVHKGDRVWWDLHDWRATESIPAVVGSFPEPFSTGIGGRRYPTTLECAADASSACRRVSDAFGRVGVVASTQQFGTGSGTDSLNVLVATWSTLRQALVADLIDKGPSSSGVYAKFTRGGRALELLDPGGHVARTLGAGAGLVAATADVSGTPTWLITGTDSAGVAAAAAALTPTALADHFALAVQGGRRLALPLLPAS